LLPELTEFEVVARNGRKATNMTDFSSELAVRMYLLYLIISVVTTIWVARTLSKNGLVFLVDAFHGNHELANSVNHLLVVGFYLINVGFVALALQSSARPNSFRELLEILSWKQGMVLITLGAMHFMNIAIFNRLRRRAVREMARIQVGLKNAGNPSAPCSRSGIQGAAGSRWMCKPSRSS